MRTKTNKFSWAYIGSIFGTSFQLAFLLLTLWGVGWTFYRHGQNQGMIATVAPPYAWYRGIAAIWEDPKWMDEWEEKSELIGTLLIQAYEGERPSSAISDRMDIREWIEEISPEAVEELHRSAIGFADALILYGKHMTEDASEFRSIRPIAESGLESYVSQFAEDKGFMRAWQQIVGNDPLLRDTIDGAYSNYSPKARSEARRVLQDEDFYTLWEGKIRLAVNEIFAE